MGVDGAVGAQPAHGGGHQGHIPVNDDPNDDINVLVLHFPYGALGIPDTAVAGDVFTLVLTGTSNGIPFETSGTVVLKPRNPDQDEQANNDVPADAPGNSGSHRKNEDKGNNGNAGGQGGGNGNGNNGNGQGNGGEPEPPQNPVPDPEPEPESGGQGNGNGVAGQGKGKGNE